MRAVGKYWGYDQLRPLQMEAIEAGLEGDDSMVVLATGGGKSLCYAVPPLVANRTDVVVSPLISLMKDQVDALNACGYPAAALHTGLSEAERQKIETDMAAGKYRLVFVAPERLLTARFLALAKRTNVHAFAIDEAHCISHWGHDFRPEYRQLAALKQHFPGAALHTYTATATDRVRQDIIAQLGLQNPRIFIGQFDRPNLVYRVLPRLDRDGQVLDVIRHHEREAVIVYCISRIDTERMATMLRAKGVKAAHYHAGLDPLTRAKTQEEFAAEKLDVVVATVAFGMGIDRSNVRCIVHAAMPKSIEQYQQETGRAGRDGLEAECVLFFAPGDVGRWESLLEKTADEMGQLPEVTAAQTELLHDMQRFCNSQECRHRALSRYFGQGYEKEDCGACDVCLTPADLLENGTEVAQRVLSCVEGLGSPFGVDYLVDVLTGTGSQRNQQHRNLPEFGTLRSLSKDAVRDVVYQLIEQGLLERTKGDRPVLKLRPSGRGVLSGRTEVTLFAPKSLTPKQSNREEAGWRNVDRGLFERLREVRRDIAVSQGVPAFVVLGDGTLRELARLRPTSLAAFRRVPGIGDRKLAELGERFIAAIVAYCNEHGVAMDAPMDVRPRSRSSNVGREKRLAYSLFDQGRSLEEVAEKTGRARGSGSADGGRTAAAGL